MNMSKIYNFNPGPAILPQEVLLKVKKNFLNWNNSGCSIVEISHRSKEFIQHTIEIEKNLRLILNIPDHYHILFSHGGARGQFSAIPLNLINRFKNPDYINSGYWSLCAAQEAKKYCDLNIINVMKVKKNKKKYIQKSKKWKLSSHNTYLHYCPNETIEGIEIFEEPTLYNKIIIGDFSSTLLSRRININNYGIIYACAQKNIGPAGITLVIIRDDLLTNFKTAFPSILDYKLLVQSQSMLNTPSVFSWYVSGLVFQWINKMGGLTVIEKKNKEKSKILYEYLDSTYLYQNDILPINRSRMNVTFYLKKSKLTNIFLQKAEKFGLYGLKGHSIIGGIRASIYNAMPIKGIQRLIQFMKKFEKKFS